MSEHKPIRVLILATSGYEESELFVPRQVLSEAGMSVKLASPSMQPINGVIYNASDGKHNESQNFITPDLTLDEVNSSDYDILVVPGGLSNPDRLRMEPRAVAIAKDLMAANKVVASICHGPWLLVETRMLKGKRMTGWYSIRTDLENAGATVLDETVVIDGNLITSRKPSDLPAFTAAIIKTATSRT
jgi:protease I